MAVEFGKYQLLKRIGAGGMGQVFLARTATQGFEKLVVIKRILPHLVEDEEFITMFFDEARIAARLNHPNLVQIFELGEADGSHYLAMEYVAGDDLRKAERFARNQSKPWPVGLCCRLIADSAAGLDYAHKLLGPTAEPLQLVHRDVSPQNILVGFDGAVKLIDFGVAKAVGRSQHTATGILKGKYAYMSPEQLEGAPFDHRSDQFALGAVFWEILTGKRLFKGESDLMTMRLVRECNVPPPSRLVPGLPKALDGIVLRALAKDPKARFPEAAEFRMAIEDFTLEHSIPASPAHLVAYVRKLYAERIAREADASTLDELSGPNVFDDLPSRSQTSRSAQKKRSKSGSPSRQNVPASKVGGRPGSKVGSASASKPPKSGSASRSKEGTKRSRSAPETRRRTLPSMQAQRPSAPLSVLAVVAGALVAAGAVFAYRYLAEEPPGPQGPVRVLPVPYEPTARPLPPQLAVAQTVRILLDTTPSGAQVEVGGRELGVTPVEYLAPTDQLPVEAVFTLLGHEPERATLTATSGPAISVELRRRRPPSPAPGPKPRPPPSPLEIKQDR
jgi:eukaryotic-like serine/threonine-protein kinase